MSEECHVYIVRRADQEEWMAQAKEGEGIAAVCMRAAGEFTKKPIQGVAALYLLQCAVLAIEFARGIYRTDSSQTRSR